MTNTIPFPGDLSISDFGYDLTEDKIARHPLELRDQSKLLVWKDQRIQEGLYEGIAGFLPDNSLLVFNDSRVMEARILFHKPSGGQIEIFCLAPFGSHDISKSIMQTGSILWTCLIGGAFKWKSAKSLSKVLGEIKLDARIIEKRADDFVVEFSWSPAFLSFAEILSKMGTIPLPPYLKRSADTLDSERYQTVYARESGSVAAPTAGLHFSKKLLDNLSFRNIHSLYLTLHVGAGTFMPVKTEKISGHHMHEEFIEVGVPAVENLISRLHEPVIAVGTTSLRTLETLYWLGLKIRSHNKNSPVDLSLDQWYPYQTFPDISVKESLLSLLDWIQQQPDKKLITKTQLFIVPGYQFKIVKGLITNFHQPYSTLLLLVAALVGPAWKKVYSFALEHGYRFLSYGDGCLFLS